MAKCSRCGKPAGWLYSLCQVCINLSEEESRSKVQAETATQSQATPSTATTPLQHPTIPRENGGSEFLCLLLGLGFLVAGLYFLILAPSEGTSEYLGRDIANLHRLTLGQTFSIMGAIFLAAALRPRSIQRPI